MQKTFLLLLTATPVQNNLEELYNLVMLLKPGHLRTRKAFMEQFVSRGNPMDPRNREKLRQLLKEVMVRNTRSVTRLRLTPRFARTIRVNPWRMEADFHQRISQFVISEDERRTTGLSRSNLRRLLEAAGSSPFAPTRMMARLRDQAPESVREEAEELLRMNAATGEVGKTERMLGLHGKVWRLSHRPPLRPQALQRWSRFE